MELFDPTSDRWTNHQVFDDVSDARKLRDAIASGKYMAEITGVFDPDGNVLHVVWVRERVVKQIKPNTQCECSRECHDDAVRMVTVRERQVGPPNPRAKVWHSRLVPMCAACADYHESKVAR